ncbi:MAG: methyltransferase [Chitinophagaceae bacterium]|jgi:release factor glutamine methyltransferase
MRPFIKKITHPFLKLGLKLYYFKPRKYCYKQICIDVHPDVFPPHLTLSTKILLDFIQPLELQAKTFLELGCGTGIISLLASSKQAMVTATDINETALEFLQKNAIKNKLQATVLYSDLFEQLKGQSFDFIIINPPYYPKAPKSIKEQAWFCGENFEYFEALFKQLPNFLGQENQTFMILSEDCKIDEIKKIAFKNGLHFISVLEKKVAQEKNYIFRLNK